MVNLLLDNKGNKSELPISNILIKRTKIIKVLLENGAKIQEDHLNIAVDNTYERWQKSL